MNNLEFPGNDERLDLINSILPGVMRKFRYAAPTSSVMCSMECLFPMAREGKRKDGWPFCNIPVPCGRMASI